MLPMHSAEVFALVWPSVVVGGALVIGAAWVGWRVGRFGSLPPVRLMAWWVTRVIVPLVRSRAWWRRATVILVNNASILAVLLAVGFHGVLAALSVAALGVSLGIGLRILSSRMEVFSTRIEGGSTGRWRVVLGLALNLLEPPAILLTVGLSLGRTAIPLPPGVAWRMFAVWVLPLLLLAAAGEALWLGAAMPDAHHRVRDSTDTPAPPRASEPRADR